MTQQLFSQMGTLKSTASWILGTAMVLATPMGALAQEQVDCMTHEGYSTCAADLEIDYSRGIGIGSKSEDGSDIWLGLPPAPSQQINPELLEAAQTQINDALVWPPVESCNQSGQLVLLCE